MMVARPAALALLASLLVSVSAGAQGLPFGWAWATTDDELTVTIEAFDLIEDLEVTIVREADGRRFSFEPGDMQLGDQEALALPFPTRSSDYSLSAEGTYAGEVGVISDTFRIDVLEPMGFDVDESTFDEEARRFTMTMTQPAGHVELSVRGDTGEILAERVVEFNGEAPGTPLNVTWTQPPGNILTIDVRAVGESGAWASRQYIPWNLEFEAARVGFASGSWEIPEADMPMLRVRLAEIREKADAVEAFIEVRLYIAGYTDTVGSAADNLELSRQRARSIGEFFRAEGVRFDIYYVGFGERVLEVPTDDNVDEPRNRRSVFILRGPEPPPASENLPHADWRLLD